MQAPGRVNLIGEHTDYNGGLVLPCAIDRGTVAVAARRDDALLRVHSTTLARDRRDRRAPFARGRGWLDYVAGVVAAFRAEGLPVPGLDIAIASDLPRESGLSRSASLEVAIATLLDAAAGSGLDGADARAPRASRRERVRRRALRPHGPARERARPPLGGAAHRLPRLLGARRCRCPAIACAS